MPFVRDQFKSKGLSKGVIRMLIKGWRKSTRLQYTVYFNKWQAFCISMEWDPLCGNVSNCLEFLLFLYRAKYSYSALNTTRSMFSTIFNQPPMGEHVLITRFMRGVFNSRPNLPRYCMIWDVSVVLKYLAKLTPSRDLSLQLLTLKLAMLCVLTTGQRSQTIHSLDLDNCVITHAKAVFQMHSLLKHSTPKHVNNTVVIPAYPQDRRLCVVTYLNEYIKRTKPFRTSSKLFLSFVRPHAPVAKNTISRWIKLTLGKAGIDTNIFKAHSTRAASTSAVRRDVDVSIILKSAGWSRASTFAKFYNKPVNKDTDIAFGTAVLAKK